MNIPTNSLVVKCVLLKSSSFVMDGVNFVNDNEEAGNNEQLRD